MASVCLYFTVSSSRTVHCEVCGLVGLQPAPLHPGPEHLHHVWVAAFTHVDLREQTTACFQLSKRTLTRSGPAREKRTSHYSKERSRALSVSLSLSSVLYSPSPFFTESEHITIIKLSLSCCSPINIICTNKDDSSSFILGHSCIPKSYKLKLKQLQDIC